MRNAAVVLVQVPPTASWLRLSLSYMQQLRSYMILTGARITAYLPMGWVPPDHGQELTKSSSIRRTIV